MAAMEGEVHLAEAAAGAFDRRKLGVCVLVGLNASLQACADGEWN